MLPRKLGGWSGHWPAGRSAAQRVDRAHIPVLLEQDEGPHGALSGYFADPEGHLWEVAFNPFMPIDAEGHVQLP